MHVETYYKFRSVEVAASVGYRVTIYPESWSVVAQRSSGGPLIKMTPE